MSNTIKIIGTGLPINLFETIGIGAGNAISITRSSKAPAFYCLAADKPTNVADWALIPIATRCYIPASVGGCWVRLQKNEQLILSYDLGTPADDTAKCLAQTQSNVIEPALQNGSEPTRRGLYVVNGQLYFNGAYCRELGANAYSLITDIILGVTATGYKKSIDDLADAGIRIVRVSMTPYDAATFTSKVLGGSVFIPATWNDLAANYRNAVQTVFDYAASKGVFLLPNLIWQWKAIADMFGENGTIAFSNANSKTRMFMRAFVTCFMNQYSKHSCIAGYVAACEFPMKGQNSTVVNDVNATLAAIANIVRTYDPSRAVFSGSANFTYDGNTIRPSFNDEIQKLLNSSPEPFNTVDTHLYSTIGYVSADPINSNKPTTDLYEYLDYWLARMRYEAAQTNRPFVMTECGVQAYDALQATGQEVIGQTTKLRKMLDAIYDSGVQLALLWNYGSNIPDVQKTWNFDRDTALGKVYYPVIRDYVHKFRTTGAPDQRWRYFDPSATGFPKPAGCLTISKGSNRNVCYNNIPAFNGAAGTVLFYIKIPAANTGFTRIIDATGWDGSTVNGGWSILFLGDGLEPYLTLARTDGVEGKNTAGIQPKLIPGEWSFRGYSWNGTDKIRTYLDGFQFSGIDTAYAYGPKTRGQLVIGTDKVGTSPSSLSIAGLVYANRVLTPREIADYYNRGIVPIGSVFIPFSSDPNSVGPVSITPASVGSAGISYEVTGL